MLLRLSRAVFLAGKGGRSAQATAFDELRTFRPLCSGTKAPREGDTQASKEEDAQASKEVDTIVLLHNEDGRVIGSRSLKVAQELAKKRKMSLKKITSPPGKKEWYKIVPVKELVKNDASRTRSESKAITFGVKIGEHDLGIKAKQAAKWISQNLEVRVAVTGNMTSNKEQLVNTLKRFRSELGDTPHDAIESKPGQGILKCILRPTKKNTPEAT